MTTMIREGNRRCDARCYKGRPTTKCRCVCGGRNHAGGREAGVNRNRELFFGSKSDGIHHAKFTVVPNESTPEALVIGDTGHTEGRSVTNDAEYVVAQLVAEGSIRLGRRLFYYDSQGQLDELLVRDGKFAGFMPGPRAAAG